MTSQPSCGPIGPPDAKVMIVGEAPGADEIVRGIPFVGASGHCLDKMLEEAGLSRAECFLTNVCRIWPPSNDIGAFIAEKKKDRTPAHVEVRGKWVLPPILEGLDLLQKEISLIRPKVIIALGNTPLWALTGEIGVTKWRGSVLSTPEGIPVIPTYHPAAILRQWAWRAVAVQDLRRAARVKVEGVSPPQYKFIIRPSFDAALRTILGLYERLRLGPLRLAVDIETRAGHIACIGFAWTKTEALCIPLMQAAADPSYWPEEEEVTLMWHLHRLLTHPRCLVIGQNFLYDAQYFWRWLRYIPNVEQDTMLSQHVEFPGLQKSLAFQSSMYCDHYVFWKDEGKTWERGMGEDQLWAYNCQDCTYTLEVGENHDKVIPAMGLSKQQAFTQALFWPVLKTMIRGVRINKAIRSDFALLLTEEMKVREAWLADVIGQPLNPGSSAQMKALFIDDFRLPVTKRTPTGQPSLDAEALQKLAAKEPLVRPIINKIEEYRSLGVFLSTFVGAPLDTDERMRCSFNIAGTETYRFSSSKNAFGSGTNLQNIPKGGEEDEGLELPNIRTLFLPDHNNFIFDLDLSSADLRIVVWDCDETEMKQMLAEGRNPYIEIAKEYYHDPTIAKHLPDGREHPKYRVFKSFAHGTHYLGKPAGLAGRLGLGVPETTALQQWYFGRFPRIKDYGESIIESVKKNHYIENGFGYRRHYFDRIEDKIFREAAAWKPQSTVALYIDMIWLRFALFIPELEVLLQVHDSLVGQGALHLKDYLLRRMKEEAAKVVVPYADPLVIPVGIKISDKSWGHCE